MAMAHVTLTWGCSPEVAGAWNDAAFLSQGAQHLELS